MEHSTKINQWMQAKNLLIMLDNLNDGIYKKIFL